MCVFILSSLLVQITIAQENIKKKTPKKAMILSTIMPGLGQAYNKKGWKIPVIYAAIGTGVFFINYTNNLHKEYKESYIIRTDNNPNTIDLYDALYQHLHPDYNPNNPPNTYSEDNLIELQEYYKRSLELSYIITAGLYILNILDAYVDAHLFEFNVNENLSLEVSPIHTITQTRQSVFGINLSMQF